MEEAVQKANIISSVTGALLPIPGSYTEPLQPSCSSSLPSRPSRPCAGNYPNPHNLQNLRTNEIEQHFQAILQRRVRVQRLPTQNE
jgi:hypothetical protein